MRKPIVLFILSICALFCFTAAVQAQTVSILNEYKVQPEVWHLARPEKPGVDAYGDLNLSIPIMRVPGRGIDFDVVLNYHSGITVRQPSGWVGLGWSFDPGSITREPEGGARYTYQLPNGHYDYGVDVFDAATGTDRRQPDVYYLTLPGRGTVEMTQSNNSSFWVDLGSYVANDSFVVNDRSPWQITARKTGPVTTPGSCPSGASCTTSIVSDRYSSSRVIKDDYSSFIVKAEDGTRYVFGKPTLSTADVLQSRQFYVSTWRLIAILGVDYTGAIPTNLTTTGNGWPADTDAGSWIRFEYDTLMTVHKVDTFTPWDLTSQAQYLSAIETPTHRAVFAVADSRDANSADYEFTVGFRKKLTGIKLYSKLYSTSTTPVSEVDLVSDNNTFGPFRNNFSSIGRLRLTEIKFYGLGGASANRIRPGYKFQYSDDVYSENRRQDEIEYCVDHLGFYTLTPPPPVSGCNPISSPDPGGPAWSLTRIDFPSGGHDEITYETDYIATGQVPYTEEYDGSTSYYTVSATPQWQRQGGARVTQITHVDGMGHSADTRYSYGSGRLTGVPEGYWPTTPIGAHIRYFRPSSRGKVGVMYESVVETLPDNSSITTYYTTPSYNSSLVKTIKTVLHDYSQTINTYDEYCNPSGSPGVVCSNVAVIQGNQQWNWGKVYKTVYKDAGGSTVRQVVSLLDLAPNSGPIMAYGWTRNGSATDVPIVLGNFRVLSKTTTDYSGSSTVSHEVEYRYNAATNLVNEVTEGNQSGDRSHSTVYAFEKYPEMRAKHMLSQVASVYTWAYNASNVKTYYDYTNTTWRQPPGSSYWAPWRELIWYDTAPATSVPSLPSTVWTGTAVPAGWVEDRIYETYDAYGHVLQQKDGRGVITKFYYGDSSFPYAQTTGLKSAHLTGVRLLAGTMDGANDLKVALYYDSKWGTVSHMKDESDTDRFFTYDDFGRLSMVKNDASALVRQYSYTFPSAVNGTLNTPGVVQTDNYLTSTEKVTTRAYYDGLARLVQTQTEDGSNDIVAGAEYDALGRTWRTWKPYTFNVSTATTDKGYDEAFASSASDEYSGFSGGERPFVETRYLSDGLDRLYRSIPEGNSGHVAYDYGIGSVYGSNHTYTRVIDESGKVSRSYVDALGREVLTRQATAVSTSTTTPTLQTITSSVTRPASMPYPYVSNTETETFTVDEGQEAVSWTATFSTNCTANPLGRFTIYDSDNVAVANAYASTSDMQTGSFTGVVGESYRMEAYASVTQNGSLGCTFTTSGNAKYTLTTYTDTQWADTQFEYDVADHLVQTTMPEGQQTAYTYNTLGQLTTKDSPDAGTVQYLYDRGGNVRFSQDAKEAAAGKVFFTQYDFAGRPTRTGEATATFSLLNRNSTYAFESTTSNWISTSQYESKPSTSTYPWSLFTTQINAATMVNLKGHLAATAYRSGGVWQITLYNYDALGQVVNKYVYTQNTSGSGVNTSVNTTFTYTYDRQEHVTYRKVAVGSSAFYHWYDYDDVGRLSKVYASTSSTKPSASDVTYEHNPTGTVSSLRYASMTALPYTYTIRDWVQKIGDPATTMYPFSAAYTYYLNGNVGTSEYNNGGSSSANEHYRFSHAYDALNRLTSADFSPYLTSWQVKSWFDVTGITYDGNGNLLTLNRNRLNGFPLDRLTYHYQAGKNRLDYVDDASYFSETWDAKDSAPGAFSYDANGNLLTAPAPYSITSVSYDERNLPTSITRSGTTTGYRYTADGQRYWKKTGTATAEYYVMDGSTTAGVFTETGTLKYWNIIAGGEVVGRYEGGTKKYYYKDHLGSIRAVVDAGGTVVESRSYDPWGYEMAGKSYLSGTAAKERFTGQERDGETGLDYFGARYYMPAYGRWASVDPLAGVIPGESPYTYVSNNPVNTVDPRGLCGQTLPNGEEEPPCELPEIELGPGARWNGNWGQVAGGQGSQNSQEVYGPTASVGLGAEIVIPKNVLSLPFEIFGLHGLRDWGIGGSVALEFGSDGYGVTIQFVRSYVLVRSTVSSKMPAFTIGPQMGLSSGLSKSGANYVLQGFAGSELAIALKGNAPLTATRYGVPDFQNGDISGYASFGEGAAMVVGVEHNKVLGRVTISEQQLRQFFGDKAPFGPMQ